MTRILIVAAALVSAVAFAQAKAAPAPAPAAPAKAAPAAPAAPAPVAVAEADCDMHKAQAAMMKDVTASKAKVEMVKLDTGTASIITADKKSAPAVEKAMAGMDGPMKDAMDGKAKLCEPCLGAMAAMKAGKAMMGHGKSASGMVWTMTSLSSDAEMVKKMHAEVDAKLAAAAPAPKK